MKKILVILALFILFSSMFVYAQTTGAATTAPSPAEIVKRCLDAGKSRDECMRECIQYTTSDECERLLPKPSIFRRIADAFKPTETTTQPTECCCAIDNKYYSMNEKACMERKGRCTDSSLCREIPQTLRPGLEIGRPGTCEMKMPDPVNPARDTAGCEDCAVTICFNMFHQEFLCLDGYKRCAEKYSFCRPVFCEPAKPECGSCPGCPTCGPCEQPKDCCCQPYNQIMTENVCRSRQGKCADVSACREQEKVCCSFPTPTAVTYMPTPVPPQVLTADICMEKGGTPVGMDYCAPATKECCCQPYNQIMKDDACRSRQGKCDAVDACKEVPNTERVCCQYGTKFEYSTYDACKKSQGLRADNANCDITCCKYPTPTTTVAYVPAKSPENIARGTCLKNGGTPTTADVCMPKIQTRPLPTLTVPDVCCEVRVGYYQKTPKDQCKLAVDESYCTPKLTTAGTPLTQIATVARPLYMK